MPAEFSASCSSTTTRWIERLVPVIPANQFLTTQKLPNKFNLPSLQHRRLRLCLMFFYNPQGGCGVGAGHASKPVPNISETRLPSSSSSSTSKKHPRLQHKQPNQELQGTTTDTLITSNTVTQTGSDRAIQKPILCVNGGGLEPSRQHHVQSTLTVNSFRTLIAASKGRYTTLQPLPLR